VLLVYLAGQTFLDDGDGGDGGDEIAYSEAKAIAEDRPQTVQNVVFHPNSKTLEMELTDGRKGIRHESRKAGGSAWWSIITYLLPFVLFMGFWVFLMKRSQEKASDRRRGEWEAEAQSEADDPGKYGDRYR
jgi:ATP-dependent Zn protease